MAGPYGADADGNDWCCDPGAAPCAAADIDGLLAGAGCRVRSSDLNHVAQRLEQLESVMVGSGGGGDAGIFGSAAPLDRHLLASDAVYYNPSYIAAWVNSMLSETSSSSHFPCSSAVPPACHLAELDAAWNPPQHQTDSTASSAAAQMMEEEEDSGVLLVHLLMTCAEYVQRGDSALAFQVLDEMRQTLDRVGTRFGIGKVAGYFIAASTLCHRRPSPRKTTCSTTIFTRRAPTSNSPTSPLTRRCWKPSTAVIASTSSTST